MDRNDSTAVTGTWPCHASPNETRGQQARDPRGWGAHHVGYAVEHVHLLSPSELVDAIHSRAHRIYMHRLKNDIPGAAVDDWLHAEHEILARQAQLAGGQGPHPAVPHR